MSYGPYIGNCSYDQCIESVIHRLNSEDFLKFFLCSDIIFLAYYYDRTHFTVPKNDETFSNILEYS